MAVDKLGQAAPRIEVPNLRSLNVWSFLSDSVRALAHPRVVLDELRLSGAGPSAVTGAAIGVVATFVLWLTRWLVGLADPFHDSASAGWLVAVGLPVVGGAALGIGRRIAGQSGPAPAGSTSFERVAMGHSPRLSQAASSYLLALVTATGAGLVGREEPAILLVAGALRRVTSLPFLRAVSARGMLTAAVAGGMAAAFGTPIFGMLFALEIVRGRRGAGDLPAILSSGLIAGLLGQLGRRAPILPAVAPPDGGGVWTAAAISAAVALVFSAGLLSLLGFVADRIRKARLPMFLAPVVGGAAVGAVAFFSPSSLTMDLGLFTTNAAEFGTAAIGIALTRALALAALLGTGAVGGLFIPVLGIGLALGSGLGVLLNPLAGIDVVSIATLIAAVVIVAGVMRCPLAISALAYEMGSAPQVVLASLALGWFATSLLRRVEPLNGYLILNPGLPIDGPPSAGRALLTTTRVRDVMETGFSAVTPSTSLLAARELLVNHTDEMPVIDSRGRLWGIVSALDVDYALLSDNGASIVADVARRDPDVCWPFQTLAQAYGQLSGDSQAAIPVVDPRQSGRLVGMLRRTASLAASGLVRTTNQQSARREAGKVADVWPSSGDGARTVATASVAATEGLVRFDLAIDAASTWAGRRVRELRLPRDAYISVIARGQQMIPIRGDTLLRAGDLVFGLAQAETVLLIRARLENERVSEEPGSNTPPSGG